MKINRKIILSAVLLFITPLFADVSVKIVNIEGDVRIRFGLDENFKPASIGILLKNMDTIFCGENSKTILQIENDRRFILGSNCVLDVSDLRQIYEKDLFLYLMSKKVEQIEGDGEKTPLRLGNVSVVRGESKLSGDSTSAQYLLSDWIEWEINGALSMYSQQLFPNTVVKLHTILEKYDSYKDCGKVFFYIAKSLEVLEMDGQAIEAYQSVIDAYVEQKCVDKESLSRIEISRLAIENLKKL